MAETLPEQQDDAQQPELVAASEEAPSQAPDEIEPIVAAETEQAAASADGSVQTDVVEGPAVAALEISLVESIEPAAQIETIEMTETVVATDDASLAAAAEAPAIEIAEVVALAETVADAPAGETPVTEIAAEPITVADLPAEFVAVEAQATETAAAAVEMPANVVVLAERRPAPRKARSAVVRAGRWAAVITLIAIFAAAAATGTGFAGNGESIAATEVCALAGETCSIMMGIP